MEPESSLPLLMALVVDFDGTLTEGGRPTDHVLDALDRARARGCQLVLATGRIMAELLQVFPDAASFFDSMVCENGGVLALPRGVQRLAPALTRDLAPALTERGVDHRCGEVLIACKASAADKVLDAVHELHLDAQLVFNRAELMILPAGVSKASGAAAALRALGLSPHNAAAIGDAENDHALLNACELAVAPSNAVAALKAHADLVLDQADGDAVHELVTRLIEHRGLPRPRRWNVTIGTDVHNDAVALPASATSYLIAGGTSSGKSYLAGLIAEQLIGHGYDTLVIDPEGDHVGLRRLPNVVWLGGSELPHNPQALGDVLGSPLGNAVIDLSHFSLDDRVRWLVDVPAFVATERARRGSPHWVVLDEAHLVVNTPDRVRQLFERGLSQYCFVTFLADLLDDSLLGHTDGVVLLGAEDTTSRPLLSRLETAWHLDAGALGRSIVDVAPGTAVSLQRDDTGAVVRFHLGPRHTSHVRHWHKYATERMPQHAFHFRSSAHERTGRTAASLVELHDVLTGCEPSVIAHHGTHRDFSRWLREVVGDPVLAATFEREERGLMSGTSIEAVRARMVDAIRTRYLTE